MGMEAQAVTATVMALARSGSVRRPVIGPETSASHRFRPLCRTARDGRDWPSTIDIVPTYRGFRMAFSLLSRARFALALLFVCAFLIVQPVNAQATEPLALPDIELEAGGAVFALARLPDGRIVLAGEFSSVNGQIRNNLAMVDADGLLVEDWTPSANGEVRIIVAGAADEVFIGGEFSEIDGQPRLRLAKLSTIEAPGSRLDPVWDPGANGTVLAMAYDSAGALFVGGAFGNIGGGSRARLAKLDAGGAGGLIVAFQPGSLNGGPFVQALALDEANNQVYAGGQVAGPGGRQFVRRYQRTTGVRDAWDPDPNGRVFALQLAADGDIFIGGQFTVIGGQARQRLARVTTATTSATATAFSADVNGRITALALDSADLNPVNHRLYVAGEYSSIGGQPRERLARVDAVSGAVDGGWTPNPNGDVFDVVLSAGDGGQLVAGGPFSRIGGMDARGIARLLDADGGKDLTFAASAVQAGAIFALRTMPDGSTYLGGVFDAVRNAGDPVFETGYGNLLRLDANGELDNTWKPQVNGSIRVMRADASALLLGGGFVSVDAQPRDRLARMVNGGASLVLDAGWTPGTDGEVRDIQLDGGAVFVGGDFLNAGDGIATALRAHLARFDAADGLLSLAFTPPALDARVLALAVADGAVFAGGEFTPAGAAARNALARFDATSGALDGWNPGATLAGIAGSVRALAPVNGDGLLVGGSFDTLGGVARSNLGRVHQATGVATSYYAPAVDGPVDALVLDSTSAAHIGGSFTAINGDTRLRLARLGQVGDIDQMWAPTADGRVFALAMRNGGTPDLFAAGLFLNISGQPRVGVAAIPTVPDDIADTSVVEVTGVSASVTGQAFTPSVLVSNLDDPGRAPTGTVTVDDGTNACNFTLLSEDAGSGGCSLPARNASDSPLFIVAFFESNDDALLSAVSESFTHIVDKADTAIGIVSVTPAAPSVGEPVEIVIDFAVVAPGSGTPLGLVTVDNTEDSCQIDIGLGEDRCDLFFANTGEYTVTASYPGDADFNGDADTAEVNVSGVPVSVSITDIAPSPSVTGQAFTVSFLVEADNAMPPEGSVNVAAGDFGCGPVTLAAIDNGQGSCELEATAAGALSVVASFSGSGIYDSGESAAVGHTVNPAATSLTASSNTPTQAGETVTVSATLNVVMPGAGTPDGNITVVSDTGENCMIDRSLSETGCDLVLIQVGTRTLTVTYAGDGNFLGSSEALSHEVEQAATSTSLDSSTPNPSAPGETVVLAFSVSPVAATGAVEVRRSGDDSLVCQGNLAAGSGSCSAAFASEDIGSVSLYAAYAGDANFLGSDSVAFDHEVALIATSVVLGLIVPDPDDIRVGDTVTFTWEVTAERDNFGTLSGTVDVVSGDDSCSADLDQGSCDITLTVFGEGVPFVASYSGNDVFAPSDDVLSVDILETPRDISVDAAIVKRVLESLVMLDGGDWVMYEIIVVNQGADPIASADVLDEVPGVFDIGTVTWECEGFDGGQCGAASGSGDLMDTVELPSGGSVRYLLVGFIPEFTNTSLVANTALVDAGEDDIDPTNNQDSATYQRCAPNRQTDVGDTDLREHTCLFRDGYEALPVD
jgi:trimeric autotransporter adhesin